VGSWKGEGGNPGHGTGSGENAENTSLIGSQGENRSKDSGTRDDANSAILVWSFWEMVGGNTDLIRGRH
jgi:hypothetical protein